jgi:hypothetical protein
MNDLGTTPGNVKWSYYVCGLVEQAGGGWTHVRKSGGRYTVEQNVVRGMEVKALLDLCEGREKDVCL